MKKNKNSSVPQGTFLIKIENLKKNILKNIKFGHRRLNDTLKDLEMSETRLTASILYHCL